MTFFIASLEDLTRIKVIDNGEPMVPLPKELLYLPVNRDMVPYTGEDVFVRSSVRDKVLSAEKVLRGRDPSLSLKIAYGYRHDDVQRAYFDEMKFKLVQEGKSSKDDDIHMFIAEPSVAGHPTGGAIDATLFYEGRELDMGGKLYAFDDAETIPTFSEKTTLKQREHRMWLLEVLENEGFAPFYGEWWHFSFGDREWAAFYGEPHALYNQIKFSSHTSSGGGRRIGTLH